MTPKKKMVLTLKELSKESLETVSGGGWGEGINSGGGSLNVNGVIYQSGSDGYVKISSNSGNSGGGNSGGGNSGGGNSGWGGGGNSMSG